MWLASTVFRVPAILAQTATAPVLPTPAQLFERYNIAIGSRAAMASYQSVHLQATVEQTLLGKTWTLDTYRRRPNRWLEKGRQAIWKNWRTGYDGRYAWTTQDNPAGELLEGTAAVSIREQADFFFAFIDPARFKAADSVQAVMLDSQAVYQVRIVRQDSSVDTLYFDRVTGYKVAETVDALLDFGDMYQHVALTALRKERARTRRMHYRVLYVDYQPYGKIRLPRITREQITPGIFQTTTLQRVEFNTVDPSMFMLTFELEMKLHPGSN